MRPFKEYGAYVLLLLAFFLSRLLFMSDTPYEWDSVSFAFAIREFSIPSGAPHPPGYLYYVLSGKLVNFIFHDPLRDMMALNFIFGALTFGAIYRIGRLLRGRRAGVLAAFLFTANPFAWFYGEVAEIYVTLGCMSALCGYFFLRYERDGRPASLTRATFMLGVAGGFRPDVLLFFAPLWLYFILRVNRERKTALWQAVFLAALTLAWSVPVVVNCHGLSGYLACSHENVGAFFRNNSMFFGAPFASHLRMVEKLIAWSVIGLGPLLAIIFSARLSGRYRAEHLRDIRLFMLWTLPAMLFFALLYIAKPGYLLFLVPPVVLAGSVCIDTLFEGRKNAALKIACAITLAALPGLFYLFSAGVGDRDIQYRAQGGAQNAVKRLFRYTLNDLEASDQRNKAYVLLVGKTLIEHPSALLVFTDPSVWNFRMANYYFPETEAHLFTQSTDSSGRVHEQYEYGRNYTVQDLSVQNGMRPVLFFGYDSSEAAKQIAALSFARIEVPGAFAWWLPGDSVPESGLQQ